MTQTYSDPLAQRLAAKAALLVAETATVMALLTLPFGAAATLIQRELLAMWLLVLLVVVDVFFVFLIVLGHARQTPGPPSGPMRGPLG